MATFAGLLRKAGAAKPTRPTHSSLGTTLGAGILIGMVILIPFAVQIHPSWSVLSAAAMLAAASVAAGGFLGLLFGVPRSVGGGQVVNDAGGPAPQPLTGITANTNLEQISDWLTKIIVGVSLTQLSTIKRGGLHLFNAMAPSLGGGSQAAAFAGAEVVYFSILGFFMGWLYARLRLGVLMSGADTAVNVSDRWLGLSQRATNAGDLVTAQAAKQAAAAAVGSAASAGVVPQGPASPIDLSTRYAQLRATLAPSAARTAQLEDVVRQARWFGKRQQFTVQDTRNMFQTGDEGSRVIALGIMQGDVSNADLPSVVDAIQNARSGFEQYQALAAAELMAPTLNEADRATLHEALQNPALQQQLGSSPAGQALADRILATWA